ncbi:DUF4407 domain-containing protein [Nocardia sp. 2]|uniref:DUF4407 domain-containing protein n=1 Tax=Nocardia acididurans TaxID=2802282 RepID=A0ABS1LY11_9NOCA|nr:DUF4407 domain-containing protein [Nocardia acididurans]MBL1073277.1 DUF4407 domain-containing protein [Nocardia acididurans]
MPTGGIGDLLPWLGGAHPELVDPHERGGYSVTGAIVALFAAISGVITALATSAADWPLLAVVVAALLTTVLVGAVSRAIATASTPARDESRRARAEFGGRIAVAVAVGVLVAELACTVLFSGTIDRLLDETAQRGAESAPGVVTARTELDQAKNNRTALDQAIAKAQTDVDEALIIARCEFSAAAECARQPITGVPGRGPEERTANQMFEDARTLLAAERAKIGGLDQAVTDKDQALTAARAAAYTDGDRGLGARWVAMNGYTTDHFGAFALRLATALLMIVLALLPLLLRFWRGETSFDRAVATRTATGRIDQAATTAIAVKAAEVRVETEAVRAEQQLTAVKLEAHADTAIEGERQRKRIIASIGNFEIGVTEPAQRAVAEFDRAAQHELPAGASAGGQSQEGNLTQSPNLPAQLMPGVVTPVTAGGALVPAPAPAPAAAQQVPAQKSGGGLELPIIGTVPFTDTAARWIRPLVPSFVANAIDTATHPLRTVRQAFEEAEEITFTLRRTRKVTVDSEDSAQPQQQQQVYAQPQQVYATQPQLGYQLPPGAQHVYSERVPTPAHPQPGYYSPQYYQQLPQAPVVDHGYGLPQPPSQDELTARQQQELGRRAQRELPPGKPQN